MNAGIRKYQESVCLEIEPLSEAKREAFIIENAPLVKQMAERMAMRLPPNITVDEMVSSGIMGLLDAIDKFDASKGIKFTTYAKIRIKGAMLDELRKMDFITRSVRKEIRRIEDTIVDLELKLGRSPEDDEIADSMGVDIETYYQLTQKANGARLFSMDETHADVFLPKFSMQDAKTPSPLDVVNIKELKEDIAKALSKLTKKEQMVVSLYYYDELTLKEIAQVLDLTESRICQIHSNALIKLRTKLKSYSEK